MKLSLILGGLLIATAAGSFYYIDYLNEQIGILKGNQVVLETEFKCLHFSLGSGDSCPHCACPSCPCDCECDCCNVL